MHLLGIELLLLMVTVVVEFVSLVLGLFAVVVLLEV